MAPDQKAGVAVMGNRSNAMMAGIANRALEMLVKFGPADGSTYKARSLGNQRFVVEGPVGYFVLEDGPDGTFPYLHTT
jgi:hypothetical protein